MRMPNTRSIRHQTHWSSSSSLFSVMKVTRRSFLGLPNVLLIILSLNWGVELISSAHGEEVPEVGIGALHPICDPLVSECIPSDEQVQDQLTAELEANGRVTAFRKYIELGELLCDSLDDAPGSTLLQFAISSTETVTAQRTSYTVIGGDVFTDGNERKVWKGSVVDPAPSNNGGSPRFISMTWGSPCDVENFLLKMISFNADGTTSKTTSVPCEAGSSTQICMMQFDIDLPSNDEPLASSGGNTLGNVSDVTRHLAEDRLTSKTHTRRLHAQETKRSSRRLQSTTQIDVMVVYSEEAMDKEFGSPSAFQMETLIADEFSTTTAAATNSEIDLQFNLVFSRRLLFKQSEQDVWHPRLISLQLDALPNNELVKDVRNTYLARSCGPRRGLRGIVWARTALDRLRLEFIGGRSPGDWMRSLARFVNHNTRVADEQYAFSAVDVQCLNGWALSHEMGHNLGCLHQIGLSDGVPRVNDYAHGWENCDVSDQRFCMHTIMAYRTSGPYTRVTLNHFSNPDVSYRGLPTGTPTANNAQVIRDNMDAVSKFRVACRSDEACEGNGVCIDGVCGFDRCDPSLGNLSLGARGACDPRLNNAECGYDGGDCCQCDCKGSPDFTCGMFGYNCLNPYSECFGACEVDDDCDAGSGEICCPGKKKCEVPLEGTDPAVCGCDPEKDDCPVGTICCEEKLVCEVPEEGSNPAACGDPHMTGFLGQKFDFTGEDGGHYALIKDGAAMHMNMRVTSPVPEVPVITYITGLSISATDSEGKAHSIIIDVKDPHTTESSCPPGTHPCLADGSLRVILDGVDTLFAPSSVNLGKDLSVSAVNIPGECRSFGFEQYWERKKLEYGSSTRRLSEEESMGEWILGDPTATNMEECMLYVANAQLQPGGLFSHQSEHASFKIVTPQAIVRLSHGRLHQVAMRDPTDHFDLPEHVTWQMNIGLEKNHLSHTATGILGETFVPTLNADGTPIMSGMESIRGSQEDYRVKGSLGSIFAQDST